MAQTTGWKRFWDKLGTLAERWGDSAGMTSYSVEKSVWDKVGIDLDRETYNKDPDAFQYRYNAPLLTVFSEFARDMRKINGRIGNCNDATERVNLESQKDATMAESVERLAKARHDMQVLRNKIASRMV